APDAGLHRNQIHILPGQAGAPILPVDDLDVPPIRAEAPAVEGTDELFHSAGTFDEHRAAMRADIVKRPDLLGAGADDDDRIIENVVHDIVAGLGDLLQAAGDLPDLRPEMLAFKLMEAPIEEIDLRHEVVADLVGGKARHPGLPSLRLVPAD